MVINHTTSDNSPSMHALTCTEEPDGLVDSPQWGHIHSLSPDGTCSADTSGVLTWSAVRDSVHQHLQRILGGGEQYHKSWNSRRRSKTTIYFEMESILSNRH